MLQSDIERTVREALTVFLNRMQTLQRNLFQQTNSLKPM